MSKKETQYWKEHADICPNCLCFSPEKGLYKMPFSYEEESECILFRPHGYMGWFRKCIPIPEYQAKITISSNFGYGSRSYLYATMEINGYTILDFDIEKLYVLNNSSLNKFCVPTYHWDMLFDKIINNCKLSLLGLYSTPIIGYIDKIAEMLEQKSIYVRGYIDKEKKTKWKGDFITCLHAGDKIRDLILGLESAPPVDDVVDTHLMKLCKKFLSEVFSLEIDLDDTRTHDISSALLSVHQYLNKKKADKEYLKYLYSQSSLVKKN